MVWVHTKLQNLNLLAALREAIAQAFLLDSTSSIPLSIGFRQQGLVFRSAILLRQQIPISFSFPFPLPPLYQDLLKQIQQSFPESPLSSQNAFQFEVICTENHWLEFRLAPASLTLWLQHCQQYLQTQFPPPPAIAASLSPSSSPSASPIPQDPEQTFRWHYLQQRCQSLLRLAQTLDPTGKPQWSLFEEPLPPWEQELLDAVARYLLAQLEQEHNSQNNPRGDRHLRRIETAFWEFHRYCALFSWYPRQPERFWHYCAWLDFLTAIAQSPSASGDV